jgi:YrbI family 3-deoxy-D-manno-octulosonate 8-phosphate phosphatase
VIPFIIDCDGVMTDGTVSYPDMGRRFNLRDGHGIKLLRDKTNIDPIIMSGENDESIKIRAEKLDIYFRSTPNKYRTLNNWYGLDNGYIAISDDIPDLELLQNATLAFCPADAEDEIKAIDGIYVLSKKGGEGCVREAINMILTQPCIQELIPDLIIEKRMS